MRTTIKFGYTHSGKFHADDVFSSALLKYIYPDIKIIRCRIAPPPSQDSIIFDIGMGKYDHHQPDAEIRPNGVPYAAFGLLWRKFGAKLIGEENAQHFDETFIQPLDNSDNTGEKNLLAYAIDVYNPSWDSVLSVDKAFEQAVDIAGEILRRVIGRYEATERAKEKVLESRRLGDVIILEHYMPYKLALKSEEDINFVVFPSNRGGYCITNMPKANGEKRFPVEWCGLENNRLQEASGLGSATFCHKNGFLLSAETVEDCLKASEKAVWIEKKQQDNQ